MPNAPLRFCATQGCPNRVARGYCPAHSRQKEQARGTRTERGYDNRWLRYSKGRLAKHPWCVGYPKGIHDIPVLAEVTDHIVSARAHPELFMDESNHQSLCGDCNRRKAIDLEGGFGR